jgi:uncharacterized membrane protein
MEKKFTVRDIVIIGMLAALCIIATMVKIPYGNGAMVHLGTAAIFTSAILFGGVKAGLGAAIGSAFFDIIMGFSPYTLWSFVIKGVAGWIAGTISHSGGSQGKDVLKNVMACLVSAAWTLVGYMAAWTAVSGQFAIAITNIPSSLMTSGVGFIVALPLATAIRKSMKNYNF